MLTVSVTQNFLFMEKPYVAILNKEYLKIRRSHCFAPATILCSECRNAVYCDDRCLKADSDLHQFDCYLFAGNYDFPHEAQAYLIDTRLIARFVMRQRFDLGIVFPLYFPTDSLVQIRFKYRATSDLLSNLHEWKKSKRKRRVLKCIWNLCKFCFARTPLASLKKTEIYRLFCIIQTNAFGIGLSAGSDPKLVHVGTGLYLNVSRFNHSCDADLYEKFDKNQIVINAKNEDTFKSIASMTEEEFNRLTINYSGFRWKSYWCYVPLTSQRRQRLNKDYFFKCQCSKCADPIARALEGRSSPYECPKCRKPFVWRRRSIGLHCSCTCQVDLPEIYSEHWKIEQKAVSMWEKFMSTAKDESDLDKIIFDCEKFLVIAEKVWHPAVNLRFGQLKERLVMAYKKKLSNEKLKDQRLVIDEIMRSWVESMDRTYSLYLSKAEMEYFLQSYYTPRSLFLSESN